MTTIISATTAGEFLSLVPHLAGFEPQRSIVLVPFRGSRTTGLVRFDLPHPEASPTEFAHAVFELLERMPGIDGFVAITYCDAEIRAGDSVPFDTFVRALASVAQANRIVVVDAMCVGSDGWRSYLEPELSGHPPIPMPVADAPRPLRTQHGGARLPRTTQIERGHFTEQLRQVEESTHTAHALEGGDTMVAACDEGLTHDDALPPAELAWILVRPSLRDIALATWCHGVDAGRVALVQQLAWMMNGDAPPGASFLAGEGPRPEAARLMLALERARRVAALADGTHRAAALATSGWLSWALGRGTHAHDYALRALRSDPTHGLAAIVRDLAQGGHLPAWAFAHPGPNEGGVT